MNTTPDTWRHRLFPDVTLGILGGVVFVLSLVVYSLTVQRTVPFWDCGEFIACSYTLGVPHPPGTPLFVLLGRVFALLPLAEDISLRVNLLSVISGAFAATAAFFVLARLIGSWYRDRPGSGELAITQRLSVYAGSFSGALLFAFGATNWANSVEAEVYSLTMFLMIALVWLTMLWAERREEPDSERYLIAASFLAFIGIGIHMTVFMVMPPIFLAVILFSPTLRRDWRFWLTGVVLALVMSGVMMFLWAITIWLVVTGISAAHRRWGAIGMSWTVAILGGGLAWALVENAVWPMFVAVLIWGVGIVPWTLKSNRWRLSFGLLLVALLGYSVHLYIPIRAHHNPTINENDPKSWAAFRGFLERKQYGSQSMFTRALKRRGDLANQLGQHRRMGFWGFFDRQYGFNDLGFLPLFLLGLVGIAELLRRRKIYGVLFFSILLLSSVGLVLYMNFADGTRYNAAIQDAYLEVRDRDYFFTPAFVFFAMAIGMGGAGLVRWLAGDEKKSPVIWPLLGSLLVVGLPFRALQANYTQSDRSRNFLPYDYAYNILMSADPDAILFTNGDNDTFPVWCLQEVYGIRKDVRVANLSLLNTQWYIKQMKNYHDVPMDITDEEIDRLVHFRTPDGEVHRVQDQMIDVILASNKGRYPINFASTVTPPNRRFRGQSIEDHLTMVGLAYRLVPDSGKDVVDVELLTDRLLNVFQFRGIGDSTLHIGETGNRMVSNYASMYFAVADSLRRAGRPTEAADYTERVIKLFPDRWESYVYLSQLYTELEDTAGLDSLLFMTQHRPAVRNRVALNVGYAFRRLNSLDRAEEIIGGLYAENPEDEQAFRALAQFYYDFKRYDTLLPLVESWTQRNPGDDQMTKLLEQVRILNVPPIDAPDFGDTLPEAGSP